MTGNASRRTSGHQQLRTVAPTVHVHIRQLSVDAGALGSLQRSALEQRLQASLAMHAAAQLCGQAGKGTVERTVERTVEQTSGSAQQAGHQGQPPHLADTLANALAQHTAWPLLGRGLTGSKPGQGPL
jgi:hypothetical protein